MAYNGDWTAINCTFNGNTAAYIAGDVAYGGTWEASKSTGVIGPEPPPRCLEYPVMDFNKDCKVDLIDFSIFLQSWLECNLDPPEACW